MTPRHDFATADCEKTQAPISERDYNVIKGAGQASRPYSTEEIIAELFKYRAPNETTIPKFAAINQAAKNFAEVILASCPVGADRVRAIEAVRAARMLANSAISLNGLSLY